MKLSVKSHSGREKRNPERLSELPRKQLTWDQIPCTHLHSMLYPRIHCKILMKGKEMFHRKTKKRREENQQNLDKVKGEI